VQYRSNKLRLRYVSRKIRQNNWWISYEVAWIRDPVGLYRGTKIDKSEWKVSGKW